MLCKVVVTHFDGKNEFDKEYLVEAPNLSELQSALYDAFWFRGPVMFGSRFYNCQGCAGYKHSFKFGKVHVNIRVKNGLFC